MPLAEKDLSGPPKDGVYVKNLILEGAGWDVDNASLREPQPMELNVDMPIIQFKPAEMRKKVSLEQFATVECNAVQSLAV